jgi:hypothetical protein
MLISCSNSRREDRTSAWLSAKNTRIIF